MLEPSGLSRGDGKRPDGMTLIPWQGEKNVTWDVTVTETVADSYPHLSAACAGSAPEGAASRKETKYAVLDYSYTFIPLAFETYGPTNDKDTKFLQELGRRLRTISDDPRESVFLRKRISIILQRFHASLFLALLPRPLRQSLRPNHSKHCFYLLLLIIILIIQFLRLY